MYFAPNINNYQFMNNAVYVISTIAHFQYYFGISTRHIILWLISTINIQYIAL